jgi:radical SAM protein with 4Fe4S-binding SPASM domain
VSTVRSAAPRAIAAPSLAERRLHETRAGIAPTIGPQSVGIVLGNACNLNCITCWSFSPLRASRPSLAWVRQRLDRGLLSSLFADLARLSTERVIFTGGGDPLAHPDFAAIVGDAKATRLKVTLISNLTLVRRREEFLALGIDTILANFSCVDPESYVAFHPNRKAADFAVLLDLLRLVAASRTELKLVFVVCRVNADLLPRAIDVAHEIGASIQFKLMSATDETSAAAISEPQRARLSSLRTTLVEHARRRDVRTNLAAFFRELSGESALSMPIEQVGCHAGHFYSRITAAGDVYFCCNLAPELRVGSLRERSFDDLWRSERYQAIRARLTAGHYVAGCDRCGKFDLNSSVHDRLRASPANRRRNP